jgi:hypothetical protein
MFFALPNLRSSSVTECPAPWNFQCSVPDDVRGAENKGKRDEWINSPETRHQVYSAFEGVNPSVRISEPKTVGEEGNPPFRLHAFVGDYDTTLSEVELQAGIARVPFRPNYYEKTLSGNARMVWLFERPVTFPNLRFAEEFLKLALIRVKADSLAASLDKPAWGTPNRYYTNSGDWYTVDLQARIPASLLQGWVLEVSEKHVWKKDRGSIEIPLPVVWTELQKKFPEASSWNGDFTEGAMGPTFWVPGSTSPKSAIVKTTGLFTFSAHATKPFYSWADLIGSHFVEKYKTEMLGKAVEDIFHDGKVYFRKDGYGEWKPFSKEDIKDHLSTDRGLSTVKDGGMPAEVSRAVQYIQNWQGIFGAAPFVFQQPGVVVRNGMRFLNTHTRKSAQPAGEKTVWGPAGQMPFLSKFFDGFFHGDSKPGKPIDFYLSWLSRFYRGAYELNLEGGQNVFVFGPAGFGKTFLNQGVIPALMGGSAEAQSYLLGESDFNSQLFETAYWTVDDNSVALDAQTHRKWSAMIKRMAANTVFEYHAKFRVPCSVEWRGRVGVTANADEVSAAIVPDLSVSILDKLMLFRTAEHCPVVFGRRREMEKILQDEIPFLARFLLDYEIPEHCVGTARFGVKSYHDELIVQTSEQSSRTASFLEIIEDWRKTYFSENKNKPRWEGGSFQLLKELNRDELAREAGLRQLSGAVLNSQLSALKARGVKWISSSSDARGRTWIISRPDSSAAHHITLPVGHSTFSKS